MTSRLHSSSFVEVLLDGPIAWVELNDPDRLNPVTSQRIEELNDAVTAVASRDDVAVVIVTGRGRGFCSGADLSQPLDKDLPPASGSLVGPRAEWTLSSLPQPVIAMVNGAAIGYGCELALQADIRVAGHAARFGLPFARIGSVSDTGAGSWLLPRLVGLDVAAELLYTGRVIDATEALRIGLVTRTVPDGELRGITESLARSMTDNSSWSLRATKQLLWSGVEQRRAEHLAMQHRFQIQGDPGVDLESFTARFRSKDR